MPTRWLTAAPRWAVLGVVAAATGAAVLTTRAGAADVLGPGLSPGVAVSGVVLVGSLLLGLPHGAVDLARLDGSWRDRAPVAAGYVLLAGLAAEAFVLVPLVTLLALLTASVAHFGVADLELHDVTGDTPSTRFERLAVVLAGGGIPVVVPLGLHGGAVVSVLDGLTAGQGTVVTDICRAVLPLLAATVLVVVVDAVRRRRWGVSADLAALLVLFVAASPLLAFAAYFGLWHAWRQTGLMLGDDARTLRVTLPVAGARLLRQASLPSAVSIAAVAFLAAVGDRTVLVLGLAAVLCLTVPHAVLASGSQSVLVRAAAGRRSARSRGRTAGRAS